VPAHAARVGAVATQALLNPLYGPAGLDRLAVGETPERVVAALTEADDGPRPAPASPDRRERRRRAHTGAECIGWCGHHVGDGFSVAGNMLAGAEVVDASVQGLSRGRGATARRAPARALAAGEAAGGDKRGKQAAALRIHGDQDHLEIDLRVDDHAEPVVELQRLYEKSFERLQPFFACLPSRHDPVGVTDRREIEERIERFRAEREASRGGAA
jgi:uncharacterized Ntn-hydrolase superfamily protein